MSKITAIGTHNGMVAVSLECGHTDLWEPYHGYTAQEWAQHIQEGEKPLEIGKTRLRCMKRHESEATA